MFLDHPPAAICLLSFIKQPVQTALTPPSPPPQCLVNLPVFSLSSGTNSRFTSSPLLWPEWCCCLIMVPQRPSKESDNREHPGVNRLTTESEMIVEVYHIGGNQSISSPTLHLSSDCPLLHMAGDVHTYSYNWTDWDSRYSNNSLNLKTNNKGAVNCWQ